MRFDKRQLKLKIWRLFLRALRAVTLTVDDWIQAQEIKLREPAARAAAQAEVAPAASAARERIYKRAHRAQNFAAGVPGLGTAVNGARNSQHSITRRVRQKAAAPRLRYQHGQFVKEGAF